MPRKSKIKSRKSASNKELLPETDTDKSYIYSSPEKETSGKSFWSKKTIALVVILLIFVLFWKFKNLLIVAVVDGQPIARWHLTDQLVKKFGDQMLDNIISERILAAELRKKGVFIAPTDVDNRIKDVEKRLDGKIALNDALKAQGMSMDDFKRQVEIQLSIDRLFDKEATVSTQEIDDYIAKNSATYKDATDPAALKDEVKSMLRQQKIADLFDTWYSEIRKNAKISKFL